MTKYCFNCGKQLPADAKFCSDCGAEQKITAQAGPQPDPQVERTQPNDQTGAGTDQSNSQSQQTTQTVFVTDQPYNETGTPNLVDATKLFFRDSLTMNKRMGRADYWWAQLGIALINLVGGLVFILLIALLAGFGTPAFGLLVIFYGLLIVYLVLLGIAGLTAQVRRLHDMGLSGAFWLVNFIPMVGSLVVFIILLQPSKQFGNQYG